MNPKGILIVVSGFSGAGKGTLMKSLLSTYDNYALSTSMTTRAMREGELHGKEYFFATKEEFEEKIQKNELIEYASYCNNYYGTPKAYVEEQLGNGQNVILEIEIQGALKIKELYPNALLLFIMPPSIAILRERLIGRGTETEEVIHERLKRATEEAWGIEEYDYIVINDDLLTCTERIHHIIESAKCVPKRNQEFIDQIRKELE
ncbi:MAG: guanylate kinase [Lachnospiraceae bacterium]